MGVDTDAAIVAGGERAKPVHPNLLRVLALPAAVKSRRGQVKYSPDQERDDHGRFGSGGGTATLTAVAPEHLDSMLTEWAKGDPVEMQHVQVTGAGNENLFAHSSRGLPREAMPVIPSTGDPVQRFRAMLDDRGIDSHFEQVDPRTLTATQGQLDGAKVGYLYQKLKDTDGQDQRVIVVDRDGNILDGHHRWAANAAYAVRDPAHKVSVLRADTGIDRLMALGHEFSKTNGIESRAFGEYGEHPTPASKGLRFASDAADDTEFKAARVASGQWLEAMPGEPGRDTNSFVCKHCGERLPVNNHREMQEATRHLEAHRAGGDTDQARDDHGRFAGKAKASKRELAERDALQQRLDTHRDAGRILSAAHGTWMDPHANYWSIFLHPDAADHTDELAAPAVTTMSTDLVRGIAAGLDGQEGEASGMTARGVAIGRASAAAAAASGPAQQAYAAREAANHARLLGGGTEQARDDHGRFAGKADKPHRSASQYRQPGGAFGKEPKPPKAPFKDPLKDPNDPRPDGAPAVRGGWRVAYSGFVAQHPEAAAWVRQGDTIHRFPDDGHVEVAHLDSTWTEFRPKPDGKLHVTRRYVPPPPDPIEGATVSGAAIKPKVKVRYQPEAKANRRIANFAGKLTAALNAHPMPDNVTAGVDTHGSDPTVWVRHEVGGGIGTNAEVRTDASNAEHLDPRFVLGQARDNFARQARDSRYNDAARTNAQAAAHTLDEHLGGHAEAGGGGEQERDEHGRFAAKDWSQWNAEHGTATKPYEQMSPDEKRQHMAMHSPSGKPIGGYPGHLSDSMHATAHSDNAAAGAGPGVAHSHAAAAKSRRGLAVMEVKWSEDQPRDEHGRWDSGGGGGGGKLTALLDRLMPHRDAGAAARQAVANAPLIGADSAMLTAGTHTGGPSGVFVTNREMEGEGGQRGLGVAATRIVYSANTGHGGYAREGMGDIGLGPQLLSELKNSTAAPYLTDQGTFTPERQALHDQIVKGSLAGTTAVEHPRLVMMGGGPASGKSSIRDTVLKSTFPDPSNVVKIDADELKQQIPEVKQMQAAGDDSWAGKSHEESSYLASRTLAAAREGDRNTLLDGTGDSSVEKLSGKIDAAHAAGFKVDGNYVTVSPDEAVQRAAVRAAQTGRVVPESVIRNTYAGISRVVPQVIDKFDTFKMYDNSGPPSQPARLIASKADGGKLVVHDKDAWKQFLRQGKPA